VTAAPTEAQTSRVLVLNAGSSSLKASVLDLAADARPAPPPLASRTLDWGSDASRGGGTTGRVEELVADLATAGVEPASIGVVVHRVVHGGRAFTAPVVIDAPVLAALDALAPLAPLHNPVAVGVIRAAETALAGRPHVAVFDTAFHATLPEVAWRYPVPERWTEAFEVRRFGFHGLSVAWATERAGTLLGRSPAELGLVVAHLGNGCSVSAVFGGRSIATSMGMTPLEGLMMGTRAGSIDPGILLFLLREGRLGLAALAEDLDHGSGLLGVSGSTAGVKQLTEAAAAGDDRARLALEMFADRAAAGIAASATALPRLDAIVFTGGIGEHAGATRAAIAARLGVLAVRPIGADESGVDRVLATVPAGEPGLPLLRIEAREDIVAARAALVLVEGGPATRRDPVHGQDMVRRPDRAVD
jgi:acetate kinase